MLEALEPQVTAIKEAALFRKRVLARLEKEIETEPEDIRDTIRNYAESYLSLLSRSSIREYTVSRPEFCTAYRVEYHKRGARAVLISETGEVLDTVPVRSGRLARMAGKHSLKKLFMNLTIAPSRPLRSVHLECHT